MNNLQSKEPGVQVILDGMYTLTFVFILFSFFRWCESWQSNKSPQAWSFHIFNAARGFFNGHPRSPGLQKKHGSLYPSLPALIIVCWEGSRAPCFCSLLIELLLMDEILSKSQTTTWHWHVTKTLQIMGWTTNLRWLAGFLNHQQYDFYSPRAQRGANFSHRSLIS